MPEPLESLDPAVIRNYLRAEIGLVAAEKFDLRTVAETRSTNDDILKLGVAGKAEGPVLFAESQTAGRGRRGDAWVSPPGLNLLFSILLRPEAPIATWGRIPHLAGVAICRGIERVVRDLPSPLQLKWPNDLFLGGRKAGGILIESRPASASNQSPFAVLGAGINVNIPREQFPEDLRPIATSLEEHTGRILNRNEIAASILAEWAAIYPGNLTNFGPVLEEMKRRSLLLGREVSIHTGGGEITGVAREFGPDGELIFSDQTSGESHPIRSADRVRLVPAAND